MGADLADQIRARFTSPAATLRELFARITFNILIGNTDDHARNHAAFWDGEELSLTPAYARIIIDEQIDTIRTNWEEVCDLARMTIVDRKQLWSSAILNPYATYDYQS